MMPTPAVPRPTRRWASVAGLVAAGVLGAAWLLARLGRRTPRASPRIDGDLHFECTVIRGIAGDGALRINARVRNDGASALPATVLVAADEASLEALAPLAARIAREAPVYVPELPGFGASDADLRPLRATELADALAAWMEGRPLNGALLAGVGRGAGIAMEVALRRPELATGLVLVDPADVAEGPERLEAMLPSLTLPIRILRGARDRNAPALRALARLADAPEPVAIPHAGRAVHREAPDGLAGVIVQFARALAGCALAYSGARQEV